MRGNVRPVRVRVKVTKKAGRKNTKPKAKKTKRKY